MNLGSYQTHKRDKSNFMQATELALVHSGDDFFKRAVDIIHRSKKTLHFQTYIFIDDSTGKIIIDALHHAVKRGVKVYLLVDAFGSLDLHTDSVKRIESFGIHFRKFSPLFYKHRLRFGRRLHHKIVLADNTEALIGGINVEDKYRVSGPETPWLDYAVYVKGPVCRKVLNICEVLWKSKGRVMQNKIFHTLDKDIGTDDGIPVKVRQNNYLFRREGISLSLRHALRHSHSSVIFMASYFMPGNRIRRLLKKASERGVKIKVILQGVSDVSLSKNATTYLYDWMFRHNIEIYEWNNTILHGKISMVDDKWTSIGSYNINHLSDYSSVETNIEVYDADFSSKIHHELLKVMAHSEKITKSVFHKRVGLLNRFTYWLAYYAVRFLFWVEFKLLSKE